ncbi:MAG TPA: NAD(P)-binding domain-containing protein [Candidatus Limnocylindrales bacterium]|nr:NAD(P)-binding domain-containing protein [Candidatus Limnocylindrales bacterium]
MNGVNDVQRIDTLVIGGGQAGLAAGYHLKRRGVPFVILDADARTGDHWRAHWDSLRLYSPAMADNLPGMRFPAPSYHYPSGREMGDYLETYAQRFDLPVVHGTRVDGLRKLPGDDRGFLVSAGDRHYEASQVVVATGAFNRPRVPAFAAELDPSIRQLHSSDYRDPSQLQPGRVLVVGLSHSGADIAYEAARSHATLLAGHARGELPLRVIDTWRARIALPILLFAARHILTLRTPIGRAMAPAVRTGGGPLLRVRSVDLARVGVERFDQRVAGTREGKPVLDDGTVLDVANVVWCTGFAPDYRWVAVPGFVGADGWPAGRRGVSSAVAGLYFLGIPFTYAFASMLVAGAGRDAAFVVDRIIDRVRATGRAADLTPATAR